MNYTYGHLRQRYERSHSFWNQSTCLEGDTNPIIIQRYITRQYFLSVNCKSPPIVVNATASMDASGRQLTVTCKAAHRFPSGTSTATFNCRIGDDGSWDDISPCARESLSYFVYDYGSSVELVRLVLCYQVEPPTLIRLLVTMTSYRK